MKKLIMMSLGMLTSLLILAQPPQIEVSNHSDEDLLAALIEVLDEPTQPMVCLPWANSPRLTAITVDGQQVSNLLSYENLWLSLNEHMLQGATGNTTLALELDKKGRIKTLQKNGLSQEIEANPALKTQKFKGLTAEAGKVIKVIVKIG